MEFQAFVVRTAALRKVFVSVKGFYYQAEIMGQAVTWLVPHSLSQVRMASCMPVFRRCFKFQDWVRIRMMTMLHLP